MPLHIANIPAAKRAALLLERQATSGLAGLTAFTNRQRNERLERFLLQQEAVGTWEASCAAVADAAQHGVQIHEENVQSAMKCCSLAGQSAAVQKLFYQGYQQLKLPKSTESELQFMESCGTTGDFAAAHRRMQFLMKRDQSPPPQSSSAASASPRLSDGVAVAHAKWAPKLSTQLVVAYLTAAQQGRNKVVTVADSSPRPAAKENDNASTQSRSDSDGRSGSRTTVPHFFFNVVAYLTAAQQGRDKVVTVADSSSRPTAKENDDASQQSRSDSDGRGSRTVPRDTATTSVAAWSVALSTFVQLRANPATRKNVTLTPQVLQQLSELADRGDQWEAAVKVVTGAAALHCLVPPESFDAAIHSTFRAKQHHVVVRLVERCLATRTPPSEASVRMALRSTEEVAASQSQLSLTSTVPLMAGFITSTDAASNNTTTTSGDAWALSLRLYQGLKDNGLALLPQTFEIPIRACSLSGKWDAAAKVLGDMKVAFGRRVPNHAYRLVLLSKIEHAPTFAVAQRLVQVPVLDQKSSATFLALLRCCVRLGEWDHFKRLRNEMKKLEVPESYETMKLQMLLALADGNPHGVVTRYTRWMQQTGFEKDRVVSDGTVPLHSDDFGIDDATLRLVVSACERLMKADKEQQEAGKLAGHRGRELHRLDPIVPIAHADALKRLSGGKDLLQAGTHAGSPPLHNQRNGGVGAPVVDAPLPSWLFRDADDVE
ncbi:Hypothetical protein, putative [Bodo saltans]|uniref:Uncharacterized protein n=1 Tax=Bodo saltans TaxID=75058 RepID=A0A0S4IQ65_BODSA|nr:Hypothetical protein, putative [Bodo saltans]|eukprot:CUF12175.1 Hypothetical protein, putative [Bodo saltans]